MICVFDDFVFDAASGALTKGDARVPVPPRALGVLAHLVKNSRRVVSRDELIEAVWPGEFLADEVLDQAVMRLRRVLGDSGRHQRYIRTELKKGYRFGVPVTFL